MKTDPRSHGLWAKTAPAAPETRALEGDHSCDVVVIGAGYTGLSAALHLAETGARVSVLEAKEIGFGGSGRNVGLVNAGLWTEPDSTATILGHEKGEKLVEMLSAAPALVFDLIERHHIECEAVRTGTLHCGVGEKGAAKLEKRARQWQRRGAPVELLSTEETCRKTGSPAYSCSLLDHRAGTIQPLSYARGLGRAAVRAGAGIFTQSPATVFERSGNGWRVSTPGGTVTAEWVIVATNAYTTSPWSELRREIVLLPYFQIATEPLSSNLSKSILPERQGAWDTKDILTSVRMDRAGRLIIGSVGALRGSGLTLHRSWARRSLAKLFPQLGSIAFEAEWYGRIGVTADAMPRLHRLEDRVLSTSGYNGRGIAPGTAFGKMMALHILGELSADDLPLAFTQAEPQRFKRPREALYELGSQIAHLRAG